MNKFETILSKVGKDVKVVVTAMFTKILPAAVKVAQESEPLVSVAADSFGVPSLGAEFTVVVNAVAAAEAAGALAGATGSTSEQKFAQVITAVTPVLLPTLTAQGLVDTAAQAEIEKYAQAVVTVTNTFPVAPTPTA